LKEIESDTEAEDEAAALTAWLKLHDEEADLKRLLREAEGAIDAKAYAKYPTLSGSEVKSLVVDDKWLGAVDVAIRGQVERVSHHLAQRVKELAERYETPLPETVERVADLQKRVSQHLEKMGFTWK
jgi:type I restriction enzyme M protein